MSEIETRFGLLHFEDAKIVRVVADKSTSTSADQFEIELRALTARGWWPMIVSFVDPVTCTIDWSITDWNSVDDDISESSCERVVSAESLGESIIGRESENLYRFTFDVFGRMRRISVVARDFMVKVDGPTADTE